MGKGIAGYVAQTGKLLNIRNAYNHPLFYKVMLPSSTMRMESQLTFYRGWMRPQDSKPKIYFVSRFVVGKMKE